MSNNAEFVTHADFEKNAKNEFEYGKKSPTLFKKGDCILYKAPWTEGAEWSGYVTQEYVEEEKEVVGWAYKITVKSENVKSVMTNNLFLIN
jgi:hypothetical protein